MKTERRSRQVSSLGIHHVEGDNRCPRSGGKQSRSVEPGAYPKAGLFHSQSLDARGDVGLSERPLGLFATLGFGTGLVAKNTIAQVNLHTRRGDAINPVPG